MSYTVKTELFEGPFELLLYLVTRRHVDIGAISVNEIADQYLAEVARMESLDLDIASDFLLVASTLLEMKAHALVPRDRTDLEVEIEELEPSDAHRMLVERLEEYKQYKNAADDLEARFEREETYHPRPFGPDARFLGLMPDFLEGVGLEELGLLAVAALTRREELLLEAEHIASRPIPVETYVRRIFERVRTSKRLSFDEVLSGDRRPEVIVVSFLSILELYKRSFVRLVQPDAFGDIEIDYIEGSGDLVLEEGEFDG